MNARIINLRTRRKQKARADKAAEATIRAAEFGRSSAEKAQTRVLEKQAKRHLDGHKIEKSKSDDDG